MKSPRFSDTPRYRLKYVRAAHSRAPGYLRRRFDKICAAYGLPNWRKPQEAK